MAPRDRTRHSRIAGGRSLSNLVFDPGFGVNFVRTERNEQKRSLEEGPKFISDSSFQQRRTRSTGNTSDPKSPVLGGVLAAIRSVFRKETNVTKGAYGLQKFENLDEGQRRETPFLINEVEHQHEAPPLQPGLSMENSRVPSSLNRLSVQLSRGQIKTRQEAKEQEAVIHERLKRANQPIPPYEFQNYIGKGSYGRVYVA